MSKSIMSKYKNRCLINRELRLTMKSLGILESYNVTTMSANCIGSINLENSWDGFVKTIKKFVKRENYEIKHKVQAEIQDVRNDIQNQIKKVQTELKSEIRKQMQS